MANPLKQIRNYDEGVEYDLPSGTKEEFIEKLKEFKDLADQYISGSIRSKHLSLAAFELAFWQFKRSYGGGFHPSEISKGDFCMRKLYFEYTGVEPEKSKSHSQQTMRIFNLGTMVHLYIQYVYMKAGQMTDFEVPIKSKTLAINGSMDGKNTEYVYEIKTTSSFVFNKLTAPLPEHVRQASLYAYADGMDTIKFIYYNKDNCELKTFVVPIDTDSIEQFSEVVFYIKNLVKENKKTGVEALPSRKCKNRMDNRALECPFANRCFA